MKNRESKVQFLPGAPIKKGSLMCFLLGTILGIALGLSTGVYFKDDILGGAKTAIHKAETKPTEESLAPE